MHQNEENGRAREKISFRFLNEYQFWWYASRNVGKGFYRVFDKNSQKNANVRKWLAHTHIHNFQVRAKTASCKYQKQVRKTKERENQTTQTKMMNFIFESKTVNFSYASLFLFLFLFVSEYCAALHGTYFCSWISGSNDRRSSNSSSSHRSSSSNYLSSTQNRQKHWCHETQLKMNGKHEKTYTEAERERKNKYDFLVWLASVLLHTLHIYAQREKWPANDNEIDCLWI